MEDLLMLVVFLGIPIVFTLINVIGLIKADNRFFNVMGIITISAGGMLYLIFGLGIDLLRKTERNYSDLPSVVFAINVIVLFIVICIAFFKSRYTTGSNALIKLILLLSIFPALFVILPNTIEIFGSLIIFPFIYHVNLVLVSVQAIRKLNS